MSEPPTSVTRRPGGTGRGFAPTSVHEGLGLKTPRGRVAMPQGYARVAPAPGAGTQVPARLPLGR